jgi:hypothetical protein
MAIQEDEPENESVAIQCHLSHPVFLLSDIYIWCCGDGLNYDWFIIHDNFRWRSVAGEGRPERRGESILATLESINCDFQRDGIGLESTVLDPTSAGKQNQKKCMSLILSEMVPQSFSYMDSRYGLVLVVERA